MESNFFSEDDLAGLFDEIDEDALEQSINAEMEKDQEMAASSRRVKDIIDKHKED